MNCSSLNNLYFFSRRNSMAHFHHAECLANFGYLRLAVESSKRTIEHDDGSQTRTFLMHTLMKQLLQLYQDEKRPDNIMSELVYWMDVTCLKYKHLVGELQRTLSDLYEEYRPVIARIYHNLLYNKHEKSGNKQSNLS